MKISRKLKRLAVDANPILSALIRGKAHAIFACLTLELVTTEYTVREVIEHIPDLARRMQQKGVEIAEADLYFALLVGAIYFVKRSIRV